MFRFSMPEPSLPLREQKEALKSQFDRFLCSAPLRELFSLLGVDRQTFAGVYEGRKAAGGTVRELQELAPLPALEQHRNELYHLLNELGFMKINRPLYPHNSHILVLGGSLNACHVRTQCAARWADPSTRFVDGLACYRPINPVERKNNGFSSLCDTEFGAMRDSFADVFDLSSTAGTEEFVSDRNLNGISCVRTFPAGADGRGYRVWAAPSTQPELRRADTGDSLLFYLGKTELRPPDSILAVTHNRHANRQFVQIAFQLIKKETPLRLDVIGCIPDESVLTEEQYDPFLYLQDLISLQDWIERFEWEL